MVLLVTTSRIQSILESLPASCRQKLDLPSEPTIGTPISHAQLIRLARHFRENEMTEAQNKSQNEGERQTSLDALLRGTRVYVPPPPTKPDPSPEYLALKARLLAAVERDAYIQMVSSSSTSSLTPQSLLRGQGHTGRQGPSPIFASSTPTLSALHDNKSTRPGAEGDGQNVDDDEDSLTPSLVLNIFLSVIISGFSVYWALTRFATPGFLTFSSSSSSSYQSSRRTESMSEPVRVLFSFLAALLVAVAEVGIYAAYLNKVERARGRERKVRELKVVVGREELRAKKGNGKWKGRGMDEEQEVQEEDASERRSQSPVDVVDVDEIWGKGANGGVRRRVREKWEERQREVDAQENNTR